MDPSIIFQDLGFTPKQALSWGFYVLTLQTLTLADLAFHSLRMTLTHKCNQNMHQRSLIRSMYLTLACFKMLYKMGLFGKDIIGACSEHLYLTWPGNSWTCLLRPLNILYTVYYAHCTPLRGTTSNVSRNVFHCSRQHIFELQSFLQLQNFFCELHRSTEIYAEPRDNVEDVILQ